MCIFEPTYDIKRQIVVLFHPKIAIFSNSVVTFKKNGLKLTYFGQKDSINAQNRIFEDNCKQICLTSSKRELKTLRQVFTKIIIYCLKFLFVYLVK